MCRTHLVLKALTAAAVTGLSACSIVSPVPLWEMVKLTGAAAEAALPYGPSASSNTVYHLHRRPTQLCIHYNPATPVADIVPALQLALRQQAVESRVFEDVPPPGRCSAWLHYQATVAWGTPPLSSGYRSYMDSAQLTLRDDGGSVLSSSQYLLEQPLQLGKWASTQDKLVPVVSALLSGFEH